MNKYNELEQRHGYWEITANNFFMTGDYENGHEIGVWHYYDIFSTGEDSIFRLVKRKNYLNNTWVFFRRNKIGEVIDIDYDYEFDFGFETIHVEEKL